MGKGLVLYFSVYGTAKLVAEEIARQTGSDLREIVPDEPYDGNRKGWSKPASTDVFNAVPGTDKEMVVIPEAGHFDLYDLDPYVTEAFGHIVPFFVKNLGVAE